MRYRVVWETTRSARYPRVDGRPFQHLVKPEESDATLCGEFIGASELEDGFTYARPDGDPKVCSICEHFRKQRRRKR